MDGGRLKEVMDEMKQCFLYHVFTVIFSANYLLGKISMHRFHVQDRHQYGISIRRRFALDAGEFMSTTT